MRAAPSLSVSSSPAAGFTLVELMVVITIMGGLLLLVPANLETFGARSRLEGAANTLVAVVGASRAQAILDGYDVTLEIGHFENEAGEERHGYRWIVTNMPAERSEQLAPEAQQEDDRKPEEREWVETNWNMLPKGVEVIGVSEEEKSWKAIRDDRPYQVVFGPDGGVSKAFALRVKTDDLETSEENRTITIVVNGLTVEAEAYDGFAEVPPQRDETDFSK